MGTTIATVRTEDTTEKTISATQSSPHVVVDDEQ